MESTDLRRAIAVAAAPAGGWPNLRPELVQVKFCLQQGQLDEAYDLLTILQRRYPGHPDLEDLARTAVPQVDPDVVALVEEVLAGSSRLTDKPQRRRAPKWEAPRSAASSLRTNTHEPIRADAIEARHVGARDLPDEDEITQPLAAALRRVPRGDAPARHDGPAARVKTRVYRTQGSQGPTPPRTGQTIAVPTLQPPTPYGAAEVEGDGRPGRVAGELVLEQDQQTRKLAPRKPKPKAKQGKHKRGRGFAHGKHRPLSRTGRTSRKHKVVSEGASDRKPLGDSFGAGVLSRYGR
jgi:hypothetical protein